ncbi:hypothetical protein ISN45_At03g001250, partial [Arabidopsis thaliana x Arabidopsis arenosa]
GRVSLCCDEYMQGDREVSKTRGPSSCNNITQKHNMLMTRSQLSGSNSHDDTSHFTI